MYPLAATLIGGLVFGMADRWLSHGPAWSLDLSNVAAPWLALAFLAGMVWRSPALGSATGFVVMQSALVGYYGSMFVLEHVTPLSYLVARAAPWLLAAVAAGPVFGWLGSRWAVERSRVAVMALASAFLLDGLGFVALGGGHSGSNLAVHLATALAGVVIVGAEAGAPRARPPGRRSPLPPPWPRPRSR